MILIFFIIFIREEYFNVRLTCQGNRLIILYSIISHHIEYCASPGDLVHPCSNLISFQITILYSLLIMQNKIPTQSKLDSNDKKC